MSHHSPQAISELSSVADELRETFAERGHRIGKALSHDVTFREGEDPRSTLARALAKAGIRQGVAKAPSVGLATLPGGARELRLIDRNLDRRYRVRRAKPLGDGQYLIEVKDDSILQLDGDSFFREERHVFSYTLSADDLIDEIFVAEALEVVAGNPGRLVLGAPTYLGGGPPPTRGFTPTTEGLDDFDEAGDLDAEADSDLG